MCAQGYRVFHHVKTILQFVYIFAYIKVWYPEALESGVPVPLKRAKTMALSESAASNSLIQMILKIQLPKHDIIQMIKVSELSPNQKSTLVLPKLQLIITEI